MRWQCSRGLRPCLTLELPHQDTHKCQESACGWCKDRWGFSWQITPRVLLEATTDPDRAAAKRAMEAMMTMKKIDIATIEAARRGKGR